MIARRTFIGGVAASLAACALDPKPHEQGRPVQPPRPEVTMHHLPVNAMSKHFTAASLRPGLMPMGHVLNVDHFTMSEPTFPPHPHAGFSAVTWMLPWSAGAFTNRDSLGDRSLITPGALHWTQAGSGMLHEEIPEVPGTPCEGLQIFVKLPESEELTAPRAFHIAPDAVPRVGLEGGEARVLVGQYGEVRSSIPSPSQTTLIHVSVRGATTLEVPAGLQAFGLVLRGSGQVDAVAATRHDAFPLGAGPVTLEGDTLEVLLGWSAPLARVPTFQGPFCMFDRERLAQVARAYRAGEMGYLEASPVRWSRPG
jgi:hypothetical protein